ncbi:MAG TPA: NAD-dependent epimerase/dehydratase family protein [Pyrinomonadaceae bacterium]|nr:NAD-dependent epimerase/dehydratase family protein [Pyrinomonadaceae bacterium]
MRVLVTGATGFIGGRIFEDLSAAGIGIVGTCRNASQPGPNIAQLDVSDCGAVDQFFSREKFDAVIHCAGIAHRFGNTPDSVYREVNIEGTRNVATAARKHAVPKFILMSSVLVYGGGGGSNSPKKETDAKLPRDAYAQSKLVAELAATDAFKGSPVSLLILRPAPVVGEGSKGNFAKLVNAIARGRFVWLGSGRNQKSLTYVGDISAACRLFLASDNPACTKILNIASPPRSMAEIVTAISEELHVRVPGVRVPEWFARSAARGGKLVGGPFGTIGRSIETWLSEDVYSIAELAAAFPDLEITPLTEAVRRDVRARRLK